MTRRSGDRLPGLSRRTILRATSLLALGPAVAASSGCAHDPDPLLAWLSGLHGVQRARAGSVDLRGLGHPTPVAEVTTKPGLPDTDVRALLARIRRGWQDHAGSGPTGPGVGLDLVVDRFHVDGRRADRSVVTDGALDRALWLRRDGRATGAVMDGGTWHIAVPAEVMASVLMGLNPIGGGAAGDALATSPDERIAVAWFGDRMDTTLLSQVDALRRRHLGLTWWADFGVRASGGLYFPLGAPGLDEVRRLAPSLRRQTDLDSLDVGSGVARADSESFATAFADRRIRGVVDTANRIPGLRQVRVYDRSTTSRAPTFISRVVVADRAGFLAAIASLPRLYTDALTVALVRGPGYVQDGDVVDPDLADAVFTWHAGDPALQTTTYAAVADLPGVRRIEFAAESVTLTLSWDYDVGDVTSAFRALRPLQPSVGDTRRSSTIDVQVGRAPHGFAADRSLLRIAAGRVRGTVPPSVETATDRAVLTRAQGIWNGLR